MQRFPLTTVYVLSMEDPTAYQKEANEGLFRKKTSEKSHPRQIPSKFGKKIRLVSKICGSIPVRVISQAYDKELLPLLEMF